MKSMEELGKDMEGATKRVAGHLFKTKNDDIKIGEIK